jgi:hypothetical protein
VLVLATLLAASALACSEPGDDAESQESTPAPITVPEPIIEGGPPIVSLPAPDPQFLAGVLADDRVGADELAAAYDGYVGCLAAGGGAGRYAYDIELHALLTLDWRLDGDDPQGSRSASLEAACSDSFLGDVVARYYAVTPEPDDDLARRQRQAIVECVEAIDPRAAASIPASVTADTTSAGLYVDDAQQSVSFLGADEADAAEIGLCFSSMGAEWRNFGTTPAPPSTDAGG